ncbi:MAG TPA: hypothetical protein VK973_06920, partial [Arenicellales bacterium]|nr:hypothetical protein [Arenicellales bacterium]
DLDAEALSEPDLPDPGETSALSGSTPASPAAAAEPALPRKGDERTADSSAESASQEPDSAQSAAAPAGSALRQAPMAETDQETEDQLNLELDEEAVDADIPVLTNAVYVPVEASAEGAPAAAPMSRHEPRIRQCVAALRSRLRDGGLEPLSDDQEQELRAVLVELFEDIASD